MIKNIIYIVFVVFLSGCGDDTPDSVTTDDGVIADTELSLNTVASETPNVVTWVGREAMKSRNGESMGYGAILNPNSSKLIIFLDGGGACYNPITCSSNRSSYDENDFTLEIATQNALIANRTSSNNQFKDWNFVFVPYATGDVHSGSNTSANVPFNGPSNQTMVGYNNTNVVLNDLKSYFDSASIPLTEIVFSGSSAGGYGTLLNTIQLANVFGTTLQTTVLVDSGQVFTNDNILTTCLNSQWTDLWLLENAFPNDLDSVVTSTYDFDIQKIYDYLAIKYPTFNFGFLSSYQDEVIRGFYSFGQNNCPQIPSGFVTGTTFKNGLLDLKTSVLDNHSNWKVFYNNGNFHIALH